ncbi:phosphatidylinositol-4-phosphate 5-kinase-domain-containing protein [Thamnocephalis sphaerospora]|uniref:Phosphatidylinositol-4-phosphate 5-kinase-domain-containing protein n=1 Tax=Thamnocephalis sphaerospora TaxID=78915 RepID=A0A4P9XQ04_9FUNG|nr:phosphatidylinositol-4-phosphate 5-kinase-domain-containing protein [Thamnocephalis sphaerospora]|eukprot:RKP08096.1 phosphatidylinositol-4-phosphate 5-kinase-domain-containing protein [Thamnocephalis sphaerospora]
MSGMVAFVLGAVVGAVLCVAYTQWQANQESRLERRPLLRRTTSGATGRSDASETHTRPRSPPAHTSWWSSRFFRRPVRPRLDPASISAPLHAPIVGSYLPLLQSMSRPPPLPALNDAGARWEEYGRKRELARSVLHHLTNEPPLGRHLRMAVRAVLHLAHISPEAMAIGTVVQAEDWKGGGGSVFAPEHVVPSDADSSNDDEGKLGGREKRRHSTSTRQLFPQLVRSQTTPMAMQSTMHTRNRSEQLYLPSQENVMEEPDAMSDASGLSDEVTRQRSRANTMPLIGRKHSDPELLEAIARIHASDLMGRDSVVTMQPATTPRPTRVASNASTMSAYRDEDALASRWNTAVLVAAPHLETSGGHDAPMLQKQPEAHSSAAHNGPYAAMYAHRRTPSHPVDDLCLSDGEHTTTVTAGDAVGALDEKQLRESLEALQTRKRSRRRGDLLSALMDMSVVDSDSGSTDAVGAARDDDSISQASTHRRNRSSVLTSPGASRPTSSIFDTDVSFYTPAETPSATVRERGTETEDADCAAHLRHREGVSRTAYTLPNTPVRLAPPALGRAASTRHRRTLSRVGSGVQLENSFFATEHAHEWHVPGYGRVRFVDHAPQVFAELRRHFGYTLAELDEALRDPFERVTKTSGKSEAIFFATCTDQDGYRRRLLLKTLRGSEPEDLKAFLPRYMEHVRRYPDTLLPRYLGMFTFERPLAPSSNAYMRNAAAANKSPHASTTGVADTSAAAAAAAAVAAAAEATTAEKARQRPGEPIPMPTLDESFPMRMTLVLMADVFDTPLPIHERYDFKGSTVGRHTLPLGTAGATEDVSRVTLKELDFRHRVLCGRAHNFHMGERGRHKLLRQLEIDTKLLREFEFMDYSVLIGVHRGARGSVSKSLVSQRTQEMTYSLSRPSTSHSHRPPPRSSSSVGTHTTLGAELDARNDRDDTPQSRLISFLSNLLRPALGGPAVNAATGDGSSRAFDTDLERGSATNTVADAYDAVSFWCEGIPSRGLPNHELYFIGLIDVLQRYTFFKKLERGIKGANAHLRVAVDTTTISARDGHNGADNPTNPLADANDNSRRMLLSSTWSNAMSVRDMFTLEREEHSVEEPGRYAERLLDFVRTVIM